MRREQVGTMNNVDLLPQQLTGKLDRGAQVGARMPIAGNWRLVCGARDIARAEHCPNRFGAGQTECDAVKTLRVDRLGDAQRRMLGPADGRVRQDVSNPG